MLLNMYVFQWMQSEQQFLTLVDLSTDAKTLYGILLDRMGLSVKNGWLDEQGRVYIIFPVQEVMDALGCADNKATKLFRELENAGLVERKRRGLGKPNLIYVKNFADPRCRNREKNGSGAADSAQPETAKSRGNKTEWNKTEGSEPDPFSSDAEDEPDECTRLEAYFMQSLEVDLLLRACPDEEDTIHQIVNLLWIPALRNAECCGWQGTTSLRMRFIAGCAAEWSASTRQTLPRYRGNVKNWKSGTRKSTICF